MQLEHTFTVPTGVDDAFRVLRDIETIGPCMPGATVEAVDGDDFTGRMKVKVGPIQVTYRGEASFTDVDEEAHTATIVANGKEARGSGTAKATVTAALTAAGNAATDVKVTTDLTVTGKPAQFGRGVMNDVGAKLLGRFAECLATKLSEPEPEPEPEPELEPESEPEPDSAPESEPSMAPGHETAAPPVDLYDEDDDEAVLDLFEVAGGVVAKRVIPVVIGAAVVAIIIWLIKRR